MNRRINKITSMINNNIRKKYTRYHDNISFKLRHFCYAIAFFNISHYIERHNIKTYAYMNTYAYFQVKVDDYGYTHFARVVLGIGSSSAGSFVNTYISINKFL